MGMRIRRSKPPIFLYSDSHRREYGTMVQLEKGLNFILFESQLLGFLLIYYLLSIFFTFKEKYD